MTSGALEIRRLYTVMYMYAHAQSRQSISQRPIGVTPQKSYLVVEPSSSMSYIAVQPSSLTTSNNCTIFSESGIIIMYFIYAVPALLPLLLPHFMYV